MSTLQRFLLAVLPAPWVQRMEGESRLWMATCAYGCRRSTWELGGIRWKAAGNPRRWMTCPRCGRATWHTVSFKPSLGK